MVEVIKTEKGAIQTAKCGQCDRVYRAHKRDVKRANEAHSSCGCKGPGGFMVGETVSAGRVPERKRVSRGANTDTEAGSGTDQVNKKNTPVYMIHDSPLDVMPVRGDLSNGCRMDSLERGTCYD